MLPLREEPAFIQLMTSFSNPLIGILAGAVFTAIIQSSSASVGILQALASSGLIGLDGAVYVLFGQNIGTCITGRPCQHRHGPGSKADDDHPSFL